MSTPAKGPSVSVAEISHPAARRATVTLLAAAAFAAFEAVGLGLTAAPWAAIPLGLVTAGAVAFTVRLRTTFKATAVHNRATGLKRNEETRTFVKLAAPGLAEAVGHLPSDHRRARDAEELEPESSEAAPDLRTV